MELPVRFLEQMKQLLGPEEFARYEESFREERVYGLRVNTSKISVDDFLKINPFETLRPIPWIDNGFYYYGTEKPARHPYYFAGLYYLQEPSAMTPANRLPIALHDRVLDLCAAPGGKTTELGVKLADSGILVTNDISNSRAKALLKNVELFGLGNTIVMSEAPYKLSGRFTGYFDKILIDAPCSGEGMFRKEPAVARAWDEKDDANELYSKLQREILTEAVKMLRADGLLLYSTCTFSPRENEETILWLLSEYPEFETLPINGYEGFAAGMDEYCREHDALKNCVRIWPQKMQGEGHFITLLHKRAADYESPEITNYKESFELQNHRALTALDEENSYLRTLREGRFGVTDFRIKADSNLEDFMDLALASGMFDRSRMIERNGFIYYMPESEVNLSGLRILRNGLLIGELAKNRFEPSQALAMYLKSDEYAICLNLDSKNDERVLRYLKGETIALMDHDRFILNGALKGYGLVNEQGKACIQATELINNSKVAKQLKSIGNFILICVDGYPLGFAKMTGMNLKNKYLPGWRWQ